MAKYKLISFNLCPFVQRSVITLEEKEIPYEIEFIDLANKPQWFVDISPLGKVPVLVVDGKTVLFESAVINEYLDETTGPRRLHPQNPLTRAYHRAWIEFASVALIDEYKMQSALSHEDCLKEAGNVRKKLQRFEKELSSADFFSGNDLCLVDTAAAPFLQRLTWCEEIVPDLAIFAETPKVKRWAENLLAREAVKKSTVPNVQSIFNEYLQGKGSPTRNVPASWIGQQIK